MTPRRVPDASFRIRQRTLTPEKTSEYEWVTLTTEEIFGGRKIVLFAVPGAFTPACSDVHLPGFERLYNEFRAEGIDSVICLSVNDAFVMNQWAASRSIENVLMLPDGNGDFTRAMGMLVDRTSVGMGFRSWRYVMLVEDGAITKMIPEPGFEKVPKAVPFEVSSAQNMLDAIRSG
jgi:peroxiredoxin